MSSAFARRFQQLVDQLAGGNKKQFAELSGKSPSHIYRICRGVSRPSLLYLEFLHEQLGIDLHWLLTGERVSTEQTNPVQPRELVYAPVYDVQASAGVGSEINHAEIDNYFVFNKQWLGRELGLNGKQLVFVSIRGDSMEPTLYAGDQVLVDMTKTTIKNGDMYLIQSEDGLLAKRLRHKSAQDILVQSDNPAYPEWHVQAHNAEHFRVLGKLVWCTRAL
jgi:phage repressor protein C with HTH and peptisase S24 domain